MHMNTGYGFLVVRSEDGGIDKDDLPQPIREMTVTTHLDWEWEEMGFPPANEEGLTHNLLILADTYRRVEVAPIFTGVETSGMVAASQAMRVLLGEHSVPLVEDTPRWWAWADLD